MLKALIGAVVCLAIAGGVSCKEGSSDESSQETAAIKTVKATVPAKHDGLSFSASENSDGTFTVTASGVESRWKVKGSRVCADNGIAKMMTPSTPYCTQVNW